MNAETPMLDLAACQQFALFWCQVSEAPHLTLTAIYETAGTDTETFGAADDDALGEWIAARQGMGANIYFTPNETPPHCAVKPGKADMVAALCRHADIDPQDDAFPLAEERARLAKLVDLLKADPDFPPTAIIDSGNGLQALWATERRPLVSPADVTAIEAQTRAIETATGAAGTFNVDRLLRLPGTVNFPFGKKLAMGRRPARAVLIHAAPNLYTERQMSDLTAPWAQRVAASGYVRRPARKAVEASHVSVGRGGAAALAEALAAAGVARIGKVDDLPPVLAERLTLARHAREHLADRWAGLVDDLTEAGKDDSRSGADFSLAAMLKAAGFSDVEAGMILAAFPHGKSNGDEWASDALRLRHIARSVARSYAPTEQVKPEPPDFGDVARFRLDRLTAGEPPPRRFLLAPLMPLGTVGVLFGEGGLGKSMAALELALQAARASAGCGLAGQLPGPLGGFIPETSGGASVFVTLEDDGPEVHRRANALDPGRGRDGAPCFVVPGLDLPGFDPVLVTTDKSRVAVLTDFALSGLDTLLSNIARAAALPVRLLILDPAGDFLSGDENDAEHVKRLMRLLREKAAAHGCTILLLGHVAKGSGGTSMRGSSAWVANSRFAYSLRRPDSNVDKAALAQLRRQHIDAERIVIGQLVKANHAGAPLYRDRFFLRCQETGRLVDETLRLAPPAPDAALIEALVTACAECAAAGMPFKLTGAAGLYEGRADLPEPLARLSRTKLEALGNRVVEAGRLVKCKGAGSRVPDCLDVPDGPYAKGPPLVTDAGSRAEAVARLRAQKATGGEAVPGGSQGARE